MPFITQGKTNLKYILIVVFLAAIVGGGILGYYYLWIKDLETRLLAIELKMPEKIVKDETANWKTYRNEEYGFELNYPDDWQVEDEKSFYSMPFVIFRFKPGCMFTIEVLPKEHADYNEVERLKKEGREWKSIIIAGISGTMFEGRFIATPPVHGSSLQTSIYFNKENDLYRITRTVEKEGEWLECTNTSDEILSTFKFLD